VNYPFNPAQTVHNMNELCDNPLIVANNVFWMSNSFVYSVSNFVSTITKS